MSSTLQNLTHTYSLFGSYSPRLTIQTEWEGSHSSSTPIVALNSLPPTTTVTSYTYDGLYRLTRAAYSSGETFEYEYDAVGNRLAYTRTLGSQVVTTYTYDAANRLTAVNGQAYTWDANGNLLNDGSKDYVYDQANRLTNISANGLAWSATYNGDGARLRQVTNGMPTTYTLDLAAPLVQVLMMQDASGKTAYLYGVTRIGEQQPSGWAYHLSDALGSVRQLVDDAAQVTLARGYMPYGEELWSLGDGSSAYGYTGEDWNVTTQLVFLRARYMQPGPGVFLSRDAWEGDTLRPLTFNGWLYVDGNPINLSDPTGHWPCPDGICDPPLLPRKIMLENMPQRQQQAGLTCSLTALFILLRHAGVEHDYNRFLEAEKEKKIPPKQGGLDLTCSLSGNPVCLSLQRVEEIARDYESKGIRVEAGEHWSITKLRRRLYWYQSPVMVNYKLGGRIDHSIVIVGVDLDACDDATGEIYYIYPLGGHDGIQSMPLEDFKTKWALSDVKDPRQLQGYNDWALAVYRTAK